MKKMYLVRYIDLNVISAGMVIPGLASLFETREEADHLCTVLHKNSKGSIMPFIDELIVGRYKKEDLTGDSAHWDSYFEHMSKFWDKSE